MSHRIRVLIVLLLLFSHAGPVQAAETATVASQKEEQGPTPRLLAPILVTDTRLAEDGKTVTGQELEMMPSVTGSITEALKGFSQIQYNYEQDSSLTVGEIAPPRISIFGAKPYENNFMIDGVSVTNTLNPSGFDASAGFNDLMIGGGDSTIFYDTLLLDKITVYTSNVPAEFGGFLGGVVDASLRDPLRDRWHFTLAGRYTEDSWFKLRDVDRESTSPDNQPRFSIYSASASAEGPLTSDVSLLLSASRRHATIPLERERPDGTSKREDQRRINENYFGRLVLTPGDRMTVRLDATYAPYEEKRWRAAWPGSEWLNRNRSWRFAGQTEYCFEPGLLTTKLVYAQNGFSRDSANNYRFSVIDQVDPTRSDRGGAVGNAEIRNREISLVSNFRSRNYHLGAARWNWVAGVDFGYKYTDSLNQEATVDTLIIYRVGNFESFRTISSYERISQSKNLASYGLHGQFEIGWKRLTLRPGLRLDYDDFSYNLNPAPRFKAEFDIFDNDTLRLIAGVNRYYGQQLRAYAFRRFRPFHASYERVGRDGTVETWERSGPSKAYRSDGLDTPYSDELSGAVAGTVTGFDYKLEFVQRRHRDQLISKTEDGSNYFMTNDGRGRFEGFTLSLERELRTRNFGLHRIGLSATTSRTRTFNGSYFSEIDVEDASFGYAYNYDKVFYNGSYISRSDLPADNYNAPLTLAVIWGSRFLDDRLRLQSVTRWRDSARGLLADARFSDDTPYGTTSGRNDRTSSEWINEDGGYSDAYKRGTISGGVVTDLILEADAFQRGRYGLTLIGEVVNLFNSTMGTSVAEGGARSRGRGFYAGMRASF